MSADATTSVPSPHEQAADVLSAWRALLRPLARLAVARGLSHAALHATLKEVLVEAAAQAHADLPAHRRVSRISTTLGLNRREVTRLTRTPAPSPAPRPAWATEVFLRWRTDTAWRDARGGPRVLARSGPGRSFETLARSVTQDVHPRSLLDELCRLGLARLEADGQRVALAADAFVPRGDQGRMLGFLTDNVGDHLQAAVANVLGDGREHFEQAIFADELSPASIRSFRATVTAAWRHLLDTMVPELETLIAADRKAGHAADRRLRVGLFTFEAQMHAGPHTSAQGPPGPPQTSSPPTGDEPRAGGPSEPSLATAEPPITQARRRRPPKPAAKERP